MRLQFDVGTTTLTSFIVSGFSYEFVIGMVQEEHYVSKLHFMWPQMTCDSGYPARASRVVLLSYRDNVGQASCSLTLTTD